MYDLLLANLEKLDASSYLRVFTIARIGCFNPKEYGEHYAGLEGLQCTYQRQIIDSSLQDRLFPNSVYFINKSFSYRLQLFAFKTFI